MLSQRWRNLGQITLILSLVLLAGCLEPSREDYRDDAAHSFCDKARKCDNLGAGQIPDSHSDCVVEMKAEFNQRWPADDCSAGRVDHDDYRQCMSRMLDYACEGGTLSSWDAKLRCRAANVCTAQPCETKMFGRCLASAWSR